MAIAPLPLTQSLYVNFFQSPIQQASLPSPPTSRIRYRLPCSRRLNSGQSYSHSLRFCFTTRCSISNTNIQFGHVAIDGEAQEESSTMVPDCSVPILNLSSDILEATSFDLLTEGTYADSLLTALPVLTEEEQYVLAATPAHPAGLCAFYASCVAANLVEQLWNFAWPSAIALIHPSLLPVAVIGFFTKLSIIIGGPLVGKLMDHSPRVLAYNCLNVVQAAAQLLSVGMIIHAHSIHSTSAPSLLLRPWFIVLVVAGAVESLCGVAVGIANERDWVVLLAGLNRPIALAQANAVLNRIDLVCEITGASLFGILLSKFDPMTSLKFIASLMMGLLPVALVLTWVTNKLSTGVLDRPKSCKTCGGTVHEEPEVHGDSIVDRGVEAIKLGWKEYLGQPVLPASLACVLLCFNVVLSPGSLMTAFLTQRGLHPSIVGGFSGSCAFMGVAATFVSANLVKHFGIIKAGAYGLLFQAFLLCVSVAVYFSGLTSQRSPLLLFLFFIILSRLGHMSYDVVGVQILQTGIPSSKANLIGTTEVAVSSLAESVMLVVAMVANDVSHFGLLAVLSLASVVCAAWMFCQWMLNPTDEQRSLFTFDPQF